MVRRIASQLGYGPVSLSTSGPLNVMIPSTFFAGVLTYIWPFVTSKGGYIAVGLIYGVSSGVFVSMLAAPLITMGNTHDVGVRLGMFFTIIALGALAGPPISGAINQATGGFKAVGYYAGPCDSLFSFLIVPHLRCRVHGYGLRSAARDLAAAHPQASNSGQGLSDPPTT